MQKSAPSIGKILVAAGFTLSCFGLILFLWVAFGGPVPLKSKSYRITAYFPEATALAVESDVRIGGVSVGKVKAIELAPADVRLDGQDLTEAELEIQPEFAPISSDARAILRQKTLLGETYVELTSGNRPTTAEDEEVPVALGAAANVSDAEVEGVEAIPEEGTLGVSQTEDQTQIDEIFNALDEQTRTSFQRWQQNAAVAVQGRGADLNDSLGNLGPFLSDASDVLTVLRRQKQSLKGLVKDTGTVFEALTEREEALRGLIVNSNDTFGALASEEQALQDTFQVFPTFERETRATLERLDVFQENTLPLILDLQPVAKDLSPTLRSVRQLSPSLSSLFVDLDDLVRASKKGLPSLARFVDGATPLLNSLDPFLANLNPVLSYLEFYKTSATDFLSNPPAGLSGTLPPTPGQPSAQHVLRQLGYITEETLSVYPDRLVTNRGNGYIRPLDRIFEEGRAGAIGGFPSFDCDNTGGQRVPGDGKSPATGIGPPQFAPCFVDPDFAEEFGGGRAPQVSADGNP
jgi:phospholipid/cholesterol/gamma-HCH transport system substrate-binding protein